jgi:pimeloyl-ACP methyl ester carboxylesterase
VDVGGVQTAYATLGSVPGTPLLLLNGTGSPLSQWDPALLDALARAQRVLVYDYPGLGGSSPLPETSDGRPLTFDDLADHARGLLTALGIPAADVLGWSMGGFVAQRLAVRHPTRVHRLVLAGTNPGGPRAVLGPSWVQRQDSDADGSLRAYVRANYPPGARQRGWAFITRVNAAVESGRYPSDNVPAAAYAVMVAAEDPWLRSGANLRQLARLRVPTLVITGEADVVTPPDNARILARTIPGARLELSPDAGHSFLFQRPRATADTIVGFLAE